ncbi:AAA ATPase afg3 [Tulasnella sp. JGI-2019a]|nr:AAA ATPase afg3 [Tulasnella sp. JGI-2019a]
MSRRESSGIFGAQGNCAKKETDVKVKFDDVADMDETKQEIIEFVDIFKNTVTVREARSEDPSTRGPLRASWYLKDVLGNDLSRVRDLFAPAKKVNVLSNTLAAATSLGFISTPSVFPLSSPSIASPRGLSSSYLAYPAPTSITRDQAPPHVARRAAAAVEFDTAIERVIFGPGGKSWVLSKEETTAVVYHEVHAVCGWFPEFMNLQLKGPHVLTTATSQVCGAMGRRVAKEIFSEVKEIMVAAGI